MENKDLDILNLYVKKNKSKEIIKHYESFGWVLDSCQNHENYQDLANLSLSRPHKIKNKDELQLEQVYMEEKINELGKLGKNKHRTSIILGLTIGLTFISLIVFGLTLLLKPIQFSHLFFAILFLLSSIALAIFEIIALPKLRQKEDILFNQKHIKLNEEIEQITNRAKTLLGESTNEQNK